MPRKILVRDDFAPYHVTARANNKEPFPIDLSTFWHLLTTECFNQTIVSSAEIHALVLMPNHLHLMLTVPQEDLGIVMSRLLSYLTKQVNLVSGRSGHILGGPYHWSIIQTRRYFGHALKYVYRNPVKANLCTKVEDYEFSTLYGLVGNAHLPVPIFHSRAGFEPDIPWDSYEEFLEWLNTPFSKEVEDTIQRKLRKKLFGEFINKKTRRKMNEFESRL